MFTEFIWSYLIHKKVERLAQWIWCSPFTQEVESSTPTCPSDFCRSSRPGYPHPVCSELEHSGIRVAVGDYSVTESRRWRQPYQTDKLYMCTQKHYKLNEDGRTAPGVRGNGSIPLGHSAGESRYENWITKTYTPKQDHIFFLQRKCISTTVAVGTEILSHLKMFSMLIYGCILKFCQSDKISICSYAFAYVQLRPSLPLCCNKILLLG